MTNFISEALNGINPFYDPKNHVQGAQASAPSNGLTNPVQNVQGLQSPPQPGSAQQQQGIPAPQQPPWANGPGDGSWGAPNDNLVGAYATAAMKAQPQAPAPQMGAMNGPPMPRQGGGPAPVQPAPVQSAPVMRPVDMPIPRSEDGPGYGRPQGAPMPRNEDPYYGREAPPVMTPFGAGPIAQTAGAKPPQSKSKALAEALKRGPIDAASNPNAPGTMPW